MTKEEYHPTSLDRELDRKAYGTFIPAPLPWLSLAFGAAMGVLFAYAVQQSGAQSANDVFGQISQVLYLALT